MAELAFVFLPNVGEEQEGLGDAGIETFRDAPYGSCAREAGQNSRDAKLNNDLPVRMTFDVLSVLAENIPSIDVLSGAIESCLSKNLSGKDRDFFTNASRIVASPQIPILRIADFNTKGLLGPPDSPESPFNALLKGSGVSRKDSETSGGSFGIGKNASFAVSNLQTVFYSTVYECEDDHDLKFAAQGKVKLISHGGERGNDYKATGYWGAEWFRAITESDLCPEWVRRDSRGTSIFSLGFRYAEDWAERMASSLVTNFFSAVSNKEMIFEVDAGRVNINSNTIGSMFYNAGIVKAAEESGALSDLEFARDLYSCLVSEASKVTILDIQNLGKIRIRILVGKGLPRRVGFIRNGMLITDNLRYFDRPLARFQNSRDFIAIVEPADAEASKVLKSLENPAHDAFSAERINDVAKRAVAVKALRKLGDLLRETIKSVTGVQTQTSVVLDELGEYFTGDEIGGSSSNLNSENNPEYYKYTARQKDVKNGSGGNGSAGNRQQGGSRKNAKRTFSRGGRGDYEEGRGEGENGKSGSMGLVDLIDVRNRIEVFEGKAPARRIFFSADVSGCVELGVNAVGVNSPVGLVLKTVDVGVIRKGAVIIDVVPDRRYSILVSFDEPYDGPIEVSASYAKNQEATE